jgi:hypothetical protein
MNEKIMSIRRIIGTLLTPILGMTPAVAFFVLGFFFSYLMALSGALVVSAIFFVINWRILKYNSPYSAYLLLISLLLFILFSFIPPFNTLYEDFYTLFFEIIIVSVFSMFTVFKNYFKEKILLKDENVREFQLVCFNSDIYVIKIVRSLGIAHLLIVLIYSLLPSKYHSLFGDRFLFFILLYIFIAGHFIYEFFHLFLLRQKYLTEEWLPIVDEMGSVHGKVAQSISRSSGNKYMHPVVRIALIHKGMLFLKERPLFHPEDIPELDYPFETHLRYKESLDECVMRSFNKHGTKDIPIRYLFHYAFKDIQTNRLIYLYVSNIQDKNNFQIHLEKGKWWTKKQIEENLGKGFFSRYFEKEYEFLSSAILNADRLMQNIENS